MITKMKITNQKVLALLMTALIFLLPGCVSDSRAKTVDYSQYSFTDTLWTRTAEHDTESIRFSSDGAYTYWCACGNPVNDSDLSEGYTYDDATKTINIKYAETTKETISEIIIEECDGKSIKLNFDGEIRKFVKDNNQ